MRSAASRAGLASRVKVLLMAGVLAGCETISAGAGFGGGIASGRGLPEALDLGASADGEACRASRRIDVQLAGLGAQYDVFCGAWRRPAGIIQVYPQESAASLEGFLDGCVRGRSVTGGVADGDGILSDQLTCPGKSSGALFRDVAVRDEGNGLVTAGRGLPALLPVLRRGVAGLAGKEAPVELSMSEVEGLPGVVALQDQEVLRRRGHKRNASFRFALAADDFARAVSIQDGLFGGDPERRADIALDLALNLSGQGRFAEAETLLDDTDAALASLNIAWLRDKLTNYRAVHLLNKGDLRDAQALAESPFSAETTGAVAAFDDFVDDGQITVISPREAEFVNQRRGSEVPPLYSDTELEPGIRATILRAHRAYVLASLLDLRGREGGAEALAEAARRVAAAPPGSAPWLQALIGEKQALATLKEGRTGAAVSSLSSILADWRRREPRSLLTAQLLTSLGRALKADGREVEALASYREAFELFSSVEGSFGVAPDRAGEYLSLLVTRADGGANGPATIDFINAFEDVVEPRAAVAMAQAAARLSSDTAAVEIRVLQDTERALAETQKTLQEEAGSADPERLAALRKAVDEAEDALHVAEDAARRAQPKYMQLVNKGATATDLVDAVRPGEAFVAFTATRSGGFGYAVFNGKVRPFKSELTSADAAKLVRRVRLTLRSRRGGTVPFAVGQAHELFLGVFGPVHEEMKASGVETLIFSPRGSLGSMPPAALVAGVPGGDGGLRSRDYRQVDFLGRHYAFISSPSAGSFVATRRAERAAATGGLTVFGPAQPPRATDPWINRYAERMVAQGRPERCGRIFAGQEALQAELTPLAPRVARSFRRRTVSGAAFTEQSVLQDPEIANQQVLVFVTHGFFGDGFCITEPSLLTSLGSEGDALLSATEILDMNISADLVFLAACDTARAAEGAQGLAALFDGAQLDGLVRSFIYAGARAVLATHWVADDKAADELTTRFFAQARSAPMHEALKQAQGKLMDAEATAHPYYWAPYVVIGDATHTLGS
ncbi:CHAT domain-containing protein [Pyruvatibacter mobilis]|uniref:CHAT domain-containing protein n=1 Tax=Pyruvatibacter mobilis TaxID=1712261 RepID=UPI003D13D58C